MTFQRWLEANHYGASTIRKALRDLERARAAVHRGVPLPEDSNVRTTLRRYLSYADEERSTDGLVTAAAHEGLTPLTRKPQPPKALRKQEARSFNDEDWNKLLESVNGSPDPRDQVIWAMGLTGLRIGDVLRVDKLSLRRGLRSGTLDLIRKGDNRTPMALALPAPWQALNKGMRSEDSVNVAEYVAGDGQTNPEADGAAYKRVYRRLRAIGKALGIDGRLNTHRFRRTFAVHALEHTENIKAVQDALGHRSINSTMKYVDEVNVRRAGRLQRELAGVYDD